MSIKLHIDDIASMSEADLRRTINYLESFLPNDIHQELKDKIIASIEEEDRALNSAVINPEPIVQYIDPEMPVMGVVPPPPPAAPADYDSAGVKWSSEIHARTKTKYADGKWKLKRGATIVPREDIIEEIVEIVPPPPPKVIAEDFGALIELLMDVTGKKRITMPEVIEIAQACGAPNVPSLGTMPHLCPVVIRAIKVRLGDA